MSEAQLLRSHYYTIWEGDCKGIQCSLPPIRPALTASPGRVETHERQVHTLERRLLVREMTPSLDRLADPGVHALNGVRIRYDIPGASSRSVAVTSVGSGPGSQGG